MSAVAPAAPPRATGRAPLLRLTWHLARPSAQSGAAIALPAVAFAVTTALLLTVLGGVLMFWRMPADDEGFSGLYQTLSVVALALLAVPLLSLGGAAARLSARRRDDRLATLRLLGATPAFVTGMTALEQLAVGLAGAVAGSGLYLLLMPVVGLVPFGGAPIGAASLWVGPGPLLAVVAGVALVAALSAVVGLRRVVVTPLGVRARQEAPRPHWLRAVVALAVVGAAAGVLGALGALPGFAVVVAALAGCFAAGVAVLGVVGPWAIAVHARFRVKRASTAAQLIAARTVLESPQAAWRQVGGIAMTTFVAVVGGAGMAFASAGGEEDVLMADIRTGILITLVVSFAMVACSVGVGQAAAILDRRDLHVSLDRLGMPRAVAESARTRATLGPLLFTVVVSAVAAGVLVLPLLGAAVLFAPVSVLVVLACFAGGILLVLLALRATRPIVTHVLAAPERAV
ncbi:FtsX-like permease family protein [Microbacterium gilvum]|uniref:ABC3 transporter permease C-terminal domain-containing protein n=1 Tax=Microbacterium gilvum TaxID=1336204 RepID=A0ABP8ZQ00_9MICO